MNARLCIEKFEESCASCGDFHLRSILRRMSVAPNEKIGDMDEFQAMIKLALSRLKASMPCVRVAIVGSTDTGILAALMTATQELGGEALVSSLNITLMDKCSTPLEICKTYAEKAQFNLDVVQGDFRNFSGSNRFDLVLMHGVLPFFPFERRLAYMSHIATWLSVSGILISSTHLGTKPDQATNEKRTQLAVANLQSLANAEPAVDVAAIATLTKRLHDGLRRRDSEPTVFAGLDEAVNFYQSAGLNLTSSWVVFHQQEGAAKPHRKYRKRCIVMCGKMPSLT